MLPLALPITPLPVLYLALVANALLAASFGVLLPATVLYVARRARVAQTVDGKSFARIVFFWLLSIAGAFAFEFINEALGLYNAVTHIYLKTAAAIFTLTFAGYCWARRGALESLYPEVAVIERDRLLHATLDASNCGVLYSRPDATTPLGWRITAANRRACAMLGYAYETDERNGLVSLHGASIVPEQRHEQVKKQVGKVGHVEYPMEFLTADGGRRWVRVSAGNHVAADGSVLRITSFTDDEENVRALFAARDQELTRRAEAHLDDVLSRFPRSSTSTPAA